MIKESPMFYICNLTDVSYFDVKKFYTLKNTYKDIQEVDIISSESLFKPINRMANGASVAKYKFNEFHNNVIKKIKELTGLKLYFNTAKIEIYTNKYTKMKYHTDCSLDLKEDSYIAILSQYEYKCNKNCNRFLSIKSKADNKITEIEMLNNSVILFDLETNSKHIHSIFKKHITSCECKWIGTTFKYSKTFALQYKKALYLYPFFKKITQATEEQKHEFYRCRKEENQRLMYTYPDINYFIN